MQAAFFEFFTATATAGAGAGAGVVATGIGCFVNDNFVGAALGDKVVE